MVSGPNNAFWFSWMIRDAIYPLVVGVRVVAAVLSPQNDQWLSWTPKDEQMGTDVKQPETAADQLVRLRWVSVAEHRPKVVKVLLIHFVWGETACGWRLESGLFRTASQHIPQADGDVTHWTLMPLGPNSPPEDVDEAKRFEDWFVKSNSLNK